MAEERTLGLARASDTPAEEPSKEELQRRMDRARDSISHTVTEIKETVANQVQAVKETLDWREQYKKRPIAWSVGAAGAGFLVGYGVAAMVKGDGRDDDYLDFYAPEQRRYAAQPMMAGAVAKSAASIDQGNGNGHSDGPGFLDKLSHSQAFGRVKDEVGNVGDAVLQELGKTVKQVVLPALMTSLKNFLGGYLPSSSDQSTRTSAATDQANQKRTENSQGYQPSLERGPI